MSSFPSLKQIVEGAILAADSPLSIDRMISLFEGEQPGRAEIKEILSEIEAECEDRGYELKEVSSGYRFQVKQQFGEWVGRLWEERPPRYTRALLETLALIAYKQPITRGDIEDIRGVAVSTNIIRTLLEREWIRVVGHRDVPGRPAMYATTKTFLDYFNLTSLEELPSLAEIKDLEQVAEDFGGDEELIEIRSLELGTDDEDDAPGFDDQDLDLVTEQVNNIQDNIRQLFQEDEEDAGEESSGEESSGEESAGEDDEADASEEGGNDVDQAVSLDDNTQSEPEPEPEPEPEAESESKPGYPENS